MSALQIALAVAAVLVLVTAVSIFFSARLSIRPGRIRAWSTPREEAGLDYEDVRFPSLDGVPLVGWFVPPPASAGRKAPVIISLHGWPWCRMGTRCDHPLSDLPGSRPVNLMPLTKRFHEAGYGVLMFDMSGYGEAGSRGVVTYGWLESRDVLGALEYLATRPDVDMDRVGVIGYSQGAVSLMFTLPQTDRIRAGIAVQPSSANVFTERYAKDMFKGFGALPNLITSWLYGIFGGPRLSLLQPGLQARAARNVPVLYVQGSGDRWGSVDDVRRMAEATPRGKLLVPETDHRFGGYTHMVEHPEVALTFFAEHLNAPAPSESGAPAAAGRQPAAV